MLEDLRLMQGFSPGGGRGMQRECRCNHVHLQGSVLECCTLPCSCHVTEIRYLYIPPACTCRGSAGRKHGCTCRGVHLQRRVKGGGAHVFIVCSRCRQYIESQIKYTQYQNYRKVTSEWPNMAFLSNFLRFAWLIFNQS